MSNDLNIPTPQPQNLSQSIDIGMIRDNLKLSLEERIEQHSKNLELIDELQQLGQAHRAKTSQISG